MSAVIVPEGHRLVGSIACYMQPHWQQFLTTLYGKNAVPHAPNRTPAASSCLPEAGPTDVDLFAAISLRTLDPDVSDGAVLHVRNSNC